MVDSADVPPVLTGSSLFDATTMVIELDDGDAD